MAKWTTTETEILKELYCRATWPDLLRALSNRTQRQIRSHAQREKIARPRNLRNTNRVDKLLLDTPEAYYWIGYLLADGHFGKKNVQIEVGLQDGSHLEILGTFLNVKVHTETKTTTYHTHPIQTRTIYAMHTDAIKRLRAKLGLLSTKKTSNPPSLPIEDSDLFQACLIGFIDGDGCINTNQQMKVEIDASWRDILQVWKTRIYQIHGCINSSEATLSGRGFALMTISERQVLKGMKAFARKHKLPVLARKWDRIDLTKETWCERKRKRKVGR